MMTSTPISRARWAVALMLALGLAGCGSSEDSVSKAAAKNKQVHHMAVDPANRPTADMIAGVSRTKAGPPVDLKYELREPPQPGQLLDVDVAILPDGPAINRVYAKFQAAQGLELVEGADLAPVEKPALGTVIRHVVRVLPKEDGIFTVTATVSVDTGGEATVRTYSIPVIVGDGLPEQSAKTEVAEGPAAGPSAPGTALKTH